MKDVGASGTKAILKSGHSAGSGGNETCGDDAARDALHQRSKQGMTVGMAYLGNCCKLVSLSHTKDEARRIAAKVAKLPELLRNLIRQTPRGGGE